MTTRTSRWLALSAALGLVACGPGMMDPPDTGGGGEDARPDRATPEDTGTPPEDTGTPPEDSGMVEMDSSMTGPEGGMMGGPEGGMMGGPEGGMMGGTTGDVCAAASVINLNTAGMRMGNTVRYTGSNAMAPATAMPAPTTCEDFSSAGRYVAFTYTPTASRRLLISTDSMATGFDTVLIVQDRCGAGAMQLGCNDDDGTIMSTASVVLTPRAATMGTPVTILVGGFGSTPATGAFELTVAEITEVAPGGMCDTRSTICTGDARCVPTTAGMTAGTCVAPGGRGGACRETGTACDAGLLCNSTIPEFGDCVPVVMPGGMCDPLLDANRCAVGATCVTSGMTSTCVADGAAGGRCRAMGAACDAGLACNGSQTSTLSRCRTAVAVGAACDSAGMMNACAPGSACITVGTATTCVADGAASGRCRATGAACDAGLACSGSVTSTSSRCRTAVMPGGACDTTGAMNACAAGSTCVSAGGMATCIADGASGGLCRSTTMPCDANLACTTANRCRPIVMAGGMCDTSFSPANVCAMGTSCIGTGSTGMCMTDGAAGARCRATAMPCDAGLACNGNAGSSTSRCRTAVAVGGACDSTGVMNACAPGAACITVGTATTCVADGAANGRCRSTGAACEAGLACNGSTGSTSSRCRMAVAVGAACDTTGVMNACAPGATCISGTMGATCLADGASGGRCRTSGAACDMGLGCAGDPSLSSARCRPALMLGAMCTSGSSATMACPNGSACLTAPMGSGTTCVADGASGGRCRTSGTACEAGLACSGNASSTSSRCRTAVNAGGACDPTGAMNACASPLQCVTAMGASTCQPPAYEITPIASPTFIDACAMGMRLPIGGGSRDDAASATALTIPWSFSFFGANYTNIWPSINGYAVFGASSGPTSTSGSLPSSSTGPVIAPYWQDLVLRPSPMSDLCVATMGSAGSRRMIIQWSNAFRFSYEGTRLDFEVVLNEMGNSIEFVYGTLEPTTGPDLSQVNGSGATIGLQSDMGARFVRHNTTVAPRTGLRFTPR